MQIRKYQNSGKLDDGEIHVNIDPVTITPEPWQYDFLKIGNKKFRNKIYNDTRFISAANAGEYSQILDEMREARNKAWDLGGINAAEDVVKDYVSRLENNKKNVLNPNTEAVYNSLKRLHSLWNNAGRPHIISITNRPWYSPILNIINANDYDDFIEELAHPYQLKNGENKINFNSILQTIKGELNKTYEHYDDLNHYENETHQGFVPLIRDYIYDGKLHNRLK